MLNFGKVFLLKLIFDQRSREAYFETDLVSFIIRYKLHSIKNMT